MGGPAATAQFARLFMLPGVGHCSGGQGPDFFDAVSAIVDWVEHGKAPDAFVTTKSPTSTNTVQSLPVYPYPHYHPALPDKPFDAHIDWLGSFSTQPPQHG